MTSEAADRATSGITDTSEATKDLTADIDAANERLRDFDIALDRPTVAIPRLVSAMQAFTGTAPEVDKVDEAVKQTTRSVDELLDNIRAEGTGISAFESFVLSAEAQFEGLAEDTVPRVTRDIVDAFVNIAEGDDINDAFGRLGERVGRTMIDELSEEVSTQLSTAVIGAIDGAGGLGAVGSQIVGAASALAAPVGIFAASVAAFALIGEGLSRLVPGVEETRIEPITPADILLAGGQIANLPVNLDIGAIGEGLDLSGGVDTSALLEFFGFPTGGGTGPNPFRSGSLVRGTQSLAEATGTDRDFTETIAEQMYGPAEYAAEVAAATGSALEDSVEEPDIPELDTVFSFTREQRRVLAPLETAVSEAEEFIRDFIDEDSTPEEVQAAYTALTTAEEALYRQQLMFINNATGITEAARVEARRVAGALFDREIRSANQDLVGALEDIGFELVNALTFTSGILSGSGLAIRRIPEMVEEAVGEAEPEPEPEPLREEFRFTGAQRTRLDTLRGDVTEAEDTLTRLRRDDDATPEQLTEAYNNLIAAEQALFDQEIAFIDAGAGIFTESALEEERTQARQRFRGEIFDANVDLTRGLENLGLQLTTTITDWFMILTGAQLAVEAIPEPEVPETPETPDTPAPLRERHRFSAAEQTRLDILENDVRAAEDAVGLLDESSTETEVTEAYTNLANAERALYQQKLDFIDSATGITETARQDARELAEGIFGREIFDANQRLVRSLGNIGLELVTMFDATTGILMGTALATQQIAQETADAGTETQDDSDDGVGNNLLQNAIARARFNLTGATTEQEFETARQELIRAINAYYDAEEERINGLELSEDQLRDKREDNQLARDRALRSATNAENQFTTARIRNEEEAAEASQRAANEQIAASERAAREREQILEREQRERERANQERLRSAMRLESELAGLQEDALEREREYRQDIIDLAIDTERELTDIATEGLRDREDLLRNYGDDREDLGIEFQRDIEDELRDAGFDEDTIDRLIDRFTEGFSGTRFISDAVGVFDDVFADLPSVIGNREFGRDAEGLFFDSYSLRRRLDDDDLRENLRDLGIEFSRDTADLNRRTGRRARDNFIEQNRAVDDARLDAERQREDLNRELAREERQAAALAGAIRQELAPLLEGSQETAGDSELVQTQRETAQLASQTASTAAETASTESLTAATASETAVTESNNATMIGEVFSTFADVPEHMRGAGDRLFEAGDHIRDIIEGTGLIDAAADLTTAAGDLTRAADRLNEAGSRLTPSPVMSVAGSAPPVLPPEAAMSPQHVIVDNADDLSTNVNVQPVVTQRRP